MDMPCLGKGRCCLFHGESASRYLASNDESGQLVSILLEIDQCGDVVKITNTARCDDGFIHKRDRDLESFEVRWLDEGVPPHLGNHEASGAT